MPHGMNDVSQVTDGKSEGTVCMSGCEPTPNKVQLPMRLTEPEARELPARWRKFLNTP